MLWNAEVSAGDLVSIVSGSTGSASRVLAPRDLSLEQNELLQNYLSGAELKGVVVGALPGFDSWDIRPLILVGGQLQLLRVTRYGLDHIFTKQLIQQSGRLKTTLGLTACNLNKDFFWISRPYYQQTLSELREAWPEVSQANKQSHCYALIQALYNLHRMECLHGHICPENIVVDAQATVFLDPCFTFLARSYAENDSFVSAESRDGVLTPAGDIYSLGKVLQQWFWEVSSASQQQLIMRMCSSSSFDRPLLEEVLQVFDVFRRSGRKPLENKPGAGADGKVGRVIPGQVPKPPSPAPEIVELEDEVSEEVIEEQIEQSPEELLEFVQGTASLGADVVAAVRKAVKQSESAAPKEAVKATAVKSNAGSQKGSQEKKKIKSISGKGGSRPTAQAANTSADSQASYRRFVILAALICVAILVWKLEPQPVDLPEIPLQAYWESGVPSRMAEVAERAVRHRQKDAEFIIVQDALNKQQRPGINSKLLQVAFNPLWEQSLSDSDRRLALSLALGKIADFSKLKLSPIEESHPGVILAALVSIPIDLDPGKLGDVPLSAMFAMPEPFGSAFALLDSTGEKNFHSETARALTRLLIGQTQPEIISQFIKNAGIPATLIARTRILVILHDQNPGIFEQAATAFQADPALAGLWWTWFDTDPLALWKGADKLESRFASISIEKENKTMNFERAVDLLTFPALEVSSSAYNYLAAGWPNGSKELLKQIYDQASKLTREQLLALLSSLNAPEKNRHALLAFWFTLRPDPDVVVKIMAANIVGDSDGKFGFESVRYLKDKNVAVPLDVIKKLAEHKEILVRAWAYSKLSSRNIKERILLQEMQSKEPSEKLREQIKLKLDESLGEGQEEQPDN